MPSENNNLQIQIEGKKLKNIYLIGANNWQLWPLYLDFQDKGNVIPVILSSKDKDANTNNFILLYAHALEMGYKGRSSFSYEHTIKIFDVSFFKKFIEPFSIALFNL